MRVRERVFQVVCVECVEEGPFYSSLRSVPAKINMETSSTAFRRIRSSFPPKLSLFGLQVGSADPPLPPLASVLLWYTAWWVLMSDGWCRGLVGRFGQVCGPPFACVTQYTIVCDFVCVFVVFSSYSGLVLLKS